MAADARADALAALSRFLVTDLSVGETLQRIAQITIEALPAAEVAGITMPGDDGRPTTAVYTDERSPTIDRAQYESGRGPCLDAWRTRRVVRVDDMAAARDDYPEFAERAQAHGVHSTLSLPLVSADESLGALNLYATEPRGFSTGDEELGSELTATASVVLANVAAYRTAIDLGEQLSEAMRSRAVIEQAKGILMSRSEGMTPEEAFEVLKRASQRENVKLRDIATRIVARRQPD